MSRSAVGVAIASTAIVLLLSFALSASAACLPLARTLTRGATGADVTALQQFLITQGVLSADSATGYFGSRTEKAVQNFQRAQSLVSSGTPATTGYGLVGKQTRSRIATLCANAPQAGQSAVKAHVTPKLRNPNCPQVPLPIGTSCSGKWQEVKDANKCTASWKCAK